MYWFKVSVCCIFEVLNESWQTDIDYDNGAAEKKLGRLLLCAGCTCKQTLQTLWMRLCMWYFTRSLSVGISYLFKHLSFENETRQVELKKKSERICSVSHIIKLLRTCYCATWYSFCCFFENRFYRYVTVSQIFNWSWIATPLFE